MHKQTHFIKYSNRTITWLVSDNIIDVSINCHLDNQHSIANILEYGYSEMESWRHTHTHTQIHTIDTHILLLLAISTCLNSG